MLDIGDAAIAFPVCDACPLYGRLEVCVQHANGEQGIVDIHPQPYFPPAEALEIKVICCWQLLCEEIQQDTCKQTQQRAHLHQSTCCQSNIRQHSMRVPPWPTVRETSHLCLPRRDDSSQAPKEPHVGHRSNM